ncbi:MAG: acetyl-CoA C-acetyltransferase [Candidatus Eisenbacteria bacterium]|nr:acetyl-CoA C-acetyltransferase [Candidatus Eisenbacteria bacterium]
MAKDVVIASATRTAIGRFLGGLSGVTAPKMGAAVIKEAVRRAGIEPGQVEEVLMGQVVQAGSGQAPARQAMLAAGIPPTVGAVTLNKVCASSLKAVVFAAQAIKAGDADIIVAGGMESMSNCPYLLDKARTGYKLGHGTLHDSMVLDGLWDPHGNCHMGVLAEGTVKKFNLTREEQDRYAYGSHAKAVSAIKAGRFKQEIVPIEIAQKKGDPVKFDTDEGPRSDTTVESLAKLRPVFAKDGTITAGNAPSTNDGAAAVVVMSGERAQKLGVKPLARVTGYTTSGTPPSELFEAPIFAVRTLLQKLGKKIDYFDLIEANEAFSAQALADGKALEWDWDRVNVNGGSVALGHPIGASGARVLATLLYAMMDRKAKTGLATLCLGGGNAVALSVEMG